MKKSILASTIISSALFLTACGGRQTEQASETKATEEAPKEEMAAAESMTLAVNTEESNIRWEGGTAGAKVYSHWGNIDIKEGSVTVEGEKITGGNFVVDMTSINPKDSGYSEDSPKEKLIGHLTTGDFFLIEEHPTASFTVKSHEGNKVVGDLTIRGNTNEETINIESMEMTDEGMMAKGKLVFDRQKYEVAWEHFMKDVVLADDIELDIALVAKK